MIPLFSLLATARKVSGDNSEIYQICCIMLYLAACNEQSNALPPDWVVFTAKDSFTRSLRNECQHF